VAEHPNIALARRAWQALAEADTEALGEILAADVVWHATGNTPWRGENRGFDAVLDYLARVGEFADAFEARLDDILASRDRVLLVFHASVERDGQRLEVDYLCLAHIEEGRANEVWTLPLDPDSVAHFWAN